MPLGDKHIQNALKGQKYYFGLFQVDSNIIIINLKDTDIMNIYLIIAIYWVVAVALSYGIRYIYFEANPIKKLVMDMSPRKNNLRMHLIYIFLSPIIMPFFFIFVIVYIIKEPSGVGKYFTALKNICKSKKPTSDDDLPF